MWILPYLFGAIAIAAGLKSIVTQRASLSIQLWGSSDPHDRDSSGRGVSHSEHTGFTAILIGLSEVAVGIVVMVEGPSWVK